MHYRGTTRIGRKNGPLHFKVNGFPGSPDALQTASSEVIRIFRHRQPFSQEPPLLDARYKMPSSSTLLHIGFRLL
jgi:hypothetical protein